MENNPYVVVGSPNYAAPLLNFSALSGQQNQQQQQKQPPNSQQKPANPQPNNPAANLGTAIRNWGGNLQQYFQPQQVPASVAGANNLMSGLY
jgi:hypothetical protein